MTTYSKETALYNTGAIGADIQEAGTKASKYLSSDSSGIMVYDGENGVQYPSTVSSGIKNVFIDDDSVEVRNGTDTLASFGESVFLGTSDAYHTEITPTDFSIRERYIDSAIFAQVGEGNVQANKERTDQFALPWRTTNNYSVTFTLFTDTKQTRTISLYDIPNRGNNIVLTGTCGGRTNTLSFYAYDIPHGRTIQIARHASTGTTAGKLAAFQITYPTTVPIPSLNIGGVIYTDIGNVVMTEGSSSTSNISASANTSYALGSVALAAGVWIVSVRARFTPSASGAHVSQITISTSSTPTNTSLDRLYAESTYFNQHNATFIVMPALDEPLTYYVHGTATVAGTWNKNSDAAFSIRAVKIR